MFSKLLKFGTTPSLELHDTKRWRRSTGDLTKIRRFWFVRQVPKSSKNAATSQFSSGWAWLVADSVGSKLSIMKTANADTPLAHGKMVLTCDVWEHALHRLP